MCPIGISNHTFHCAFDLREIEAHRYGFEAGSMICIQAMIKPSINGKDAF
jgi:hypothetical protein